MIVMEMTIVAKVRRPVKTHTALHIIRAVSGHTIPLNINLQRKNASTTKSTNTRNTPQVAALKVDRRME